MKASTALRLKKAQHILKLEINNLLEDKTVKSVMWIAIICGTFAILGYIARAFGI